MFVLRSEVNSMESVLFLTFKWVSGLEPRPTGQEHLPTEPSHQPFLVCFDLVSLRRSRLAVCRSTALGPCSVAQAIFGLTLFLPQPP